MHEPFKLLEVERRLEQFQQGTLTGEEWGMRAEQQTLDWHRHRVARVRSVDQPPHAPLCLNARNVEGGVSLVDQRADKSAAEGRVGIEQLHAGLGDSTQEFGKGGRVNHGRPETRMMYPLVFHSDGHLDKQATFCGRVQKSSHFGMFESITMIGGIEPNDRHLVLLVAAAEVLLPIGPDGIHAAHGDQEPFSLLAALLGYSPVDSVELFMQHGLEAAGPSLRDAVLPQFTDEGTGAVVLQRAVRPLK